jgi:hypothetical protein
MSYLTEKEYERDLEACKRMLKETYVGNIIHVQERSNDGADEEEIKQIEDIIIANEKLIVYFDQSDEWVKELHEEAKKQSGVNDDEPGRELDEFERLEASGNFERTEN